VCGICSFSSFSTVMTVWKGSLSNSCKVPDRMCCCLKCNESFSCLMTKIKQFYCMYLYVRSFTVPWEPPASNCIALVIGLFQIPIWLIFEQLGCSTSISSYGPTTAILSSPPSISSWLPDFFTKISLAMNQYSWPCRSKLSGEWEK